MTLESPYLYVVNCFPGVRIRRPDVTVCVLYSGKENEFQKPFIGAFSPLILLYPPGNPVDQ